MKKYKKLWNKYKYLLYSLIVIFYVVNLVSRMVKLDRIYKELRIIETIKNLEEKNIKIPKSHKDYYDDLHDEKK